MTRRIALAGWFGSENLGDELILRALAESLRARGAAPVAISIDPARTGRDHGIDAVAHRSPAQWPSLARALRAMDGLAAAGGLIQSETSPWNLPFHASRFWAAAAARLPAAAIGLGVGSVPGRISRGVAMSSLRRMRPVVVRDEASARRLRSWGCRGAMVGADPVIELRPEPVEPADTMCVILRPLNRRGLGTYAAKAKSSWRVELDASARAVGAAAAATGLTPRFVAFEARFDDPLHRALADRLSVKAETVAPGLATVLTEVGRSRVVVTMRYHGAVAALLHGRPAVLLDYSPKMASLAAEAGGWAPLVDPGDLNGDRLATAVSTALDSGLRVERALQDMRSRLTANDAALDDLADGPP